MSNTTQGWPAGWYADPWFAGQQRWWDGAAWTPHVDAPAPTPATPTAVPPPTTAVPPPTTATVPTAAATMTAPDPSSDPTPPSGGPIADPAPWSPPTDPWGTPAARPADPYAPPWATGSAGAGGWLAPDQTTTYPVVTPSRRRRWWVAVLVACVVVAAVAAGITVASGSGRRHRVVSGPINFPAVPGGSASPSTTIPPAVSDDPDASDLSRLDVAQADVPAGYSVTLLPGGNMVAGQVTLDLCNGTYASEALRTARRQVDLTDQTSKLWLSTEAVLYGSSSDTAQAFTELKARAANCPPGFLQPPPGEAGLPATKTVFNPAPDGSWPATSGVERLAYDFTTTDQQGNTDNSIAVYLRRGRALLGVYFAVPQGTQPAVAGKTTVEGIVGLFEQRLASLPGAVVNATVPVAPPNGSI